MSKKGQIAWNKRQIDEVRVADLYFNVGMSSVAIAKLYHVDPATIRRRLYKVGKLRTHREAHFNTIPWNKKDYYQPITFKGQVKIRIRPDDPLFIMADATGYILEHRYVMAKFLGRPLRPEETIHHRDGNVRNNTIENLKLFPNHAEHMRHHMTSEVAREKGARRLAIKAAVEGK